MSLARADFFIFHLCHSLFLTFLRASSPLALIFLLSGCQTNQARQFEKLERGLEKDQVIEIMGTPDTTWRFKGVDRWTYIFYEQDNRIEKEVHFRDGRSIYLGASPHANVIAEEQDELNEKQNIADKKAREEELKNRHRVFEEYEFKSRKVEEAKPLPVFQEIQ